MQDGCHLHLFHVGSLSKHQVIYSTVFVSFCRFGEGAKKLTCSYEANNILIGNFNSAI